MVIEMSNKDNIQELENQIQQLELQLADLQAQLPAHSIPPSLIAKLDEIDEQLREMLSQLNEAKMKRGEEQG
jgi:DNA repair exonuclease SbcCD ATPase subunit